MECGGLVCPEPRRPPLLRPQSLLRVFLPSGWPTEPAHKTIPALPNSETTAAPTQRVPPRELGSCERRLDGLAKHLSVSQRPQNGELLPLNTPEVHRIIDTMHRKKNFR